MTHKNAFLFGIFAVASLIAATPQAQATIIVGGATLNGNFNADASATDSRTFTNTPNWVNIGSGNQTAVATRTNMPFDGSRNAQVTDSGIVIHGLDTGYTIAAGDVFDISYVWRDAFDWADASDRIGVRLFVTSDDTLGGSRTNLVQALSPLSTMDSTYELVDQDAIYSAVAGDAGKRLFVDFLGVNGGGANPGFARLDDFVLEVTATPEPTSLVVFALSLFGCAIYSHFRRR